MTSEREEMEQTGHGLRPVQRRGFKGHGSSSSRRGVTAVEFAVVAPVIFLLVFGGIEIGRLQMAIHGLEAAAREGCRMAVSWNVPQSDIQQAVDDRLASFGITGHTMTINPSLVFARQWDPVTVRIEVTYDQVSWLPAPRFLQGITLAGSCTLPHESDLSD
jgi:Flp pilus assembly protein TadG